MISHRPISTGKKPWDLTAGDILHQPQTAAGGGGRAGVAVSGWRKTVSEPEQLLVCFDTETLRHALDLLMKHDISSLPVIGSSGTNTNSFLGFVDCLDIAGFVLRAFQLSEPIKEPLNSPVSMILNYSQLDPSLYVMRSSSLQSVFEFFTIPMTFDFRIQTPYEGWTSSLEQGSLSLPRYPHRGAVLNEKNAVIDIITQRDLISFLKRKKANLDPAILAKTVNDFPQWRHPVVKVRLDSTMEEALQKMFVNRIRSVAVVDENGRLDGTIQANDLRGLKYNSFNFLDYGSVLQFQAKALKRATPVQVQTVPVGLGDTIGQVLDLAAEKHCWGVYIVDEYNHPSGVISLEMSSTAALASTGSFLTRFWNHPAGPKTVHFWAPTMKWGLVMAGLGDLSRPVEKLSVMQTVSLAATGLIWSRYSLVIIPKNWNLFSVNVFVGATGCYQLSRIIRHNYFNKDNESSSTPSTAK